MATIFKTVSWEAKQLIDGVKQGSIQLPDLQRPFVWPTAKVRDLFDSMYRGYPVGELMFWDVAAEGESRAISSNSGFAAAHQIVDGQQRLTSLFAAMLGRPVRDENYRQRSITISFNPLVERFEVRTPALAKSAQWVEDISTCFDSPLRALRQYTRRLRDNGDDLDDDLEERLESVFTRLHGLQHYTFDVVHIQKDVEKRLVADIFVRINSEGVSLKAYDYILTWLSVFWPEGRDAIEEFARNSRATPEQASDRLGQLVRWTAKNPFIAVENGHIVRAMVAVGQNRGRLQDAYAALQARDRNTGRVDAQRQETELTRLKSALPIVTDPVSWTEFIHAIQIAGFRSKRNITSSMNIVYSYVLFLLGRHQYRVPLPELRTLIARWLFMSQLTARYTGSSESQMQKDLDRLSAVAAGDASGFRSALEDVIAAALTPDYWRFAMPQNLVTSGPALSPDYQCYLAALNILNADMFMLRMPVRDWMDPSLPAVKGLEGHHLFPRSYQENVLGITDTKRVNQAANFAPTDWDTNIKISDRAPQDYWPRLVAERGGDAEWLDRQMYWHALPEGWAELDYDEFLAQRRRLMAEVTRDAFALLSSGVRPVPVADHATPSVEMDDLSLRELVDAGLLQPGDLLDPVDPEWVVDAVVTEDGTILIDGVHEFDSLEEAARHLGDSNVGGAQFWALESKDILIPLSDLGSGRETRMDASASAPG